MATLTLFKASKLKLPKVMKRLKVLFGSVPYGLFKQQHVIGPVVFDFL
jgi:hypothetical protein